MSASIIQFDDVSSDIVVNKRRRAHLRHVSLALPPARIALMAPDRRDAEGVIDLLCRKAVPISGHLRFDGAVSWPIGRLASFVGGAKGTDAISLICMIYDVDRRLALDFMREEFEEPDLLATRMDRWTPPMRARFGLLASLLPQFDVYLVDGNLVHPDQPAFSSRFLELLAQRVENRTLVVLTRQLRLSQALCDMAAVVMDGTITLHDDPEAAQRIVAGATPSADEAEAESQSLDEMDGAALI